jgi:hypothetical protein
MRRRRSRRLTADFADRQGKDVRHTLNDVKGGKTGDEIAFVI